MDALAARRCRGRGSGCGRRSRRRARRCRRRPRGCRGSSVCSAQGAADVAVTGGEAEVAGQAAAAGVEPLDVDAGSLEQLAVGVPLQDRVLVAVHLGDRRHVGYGARGGSQPSVCSVSSSASVTVWSRSRWASWSSGNSSCSVGAEDRRTARLEADDETAGADVRREPRGCVRRRTRVAPRRAGRSRSRSARSTAARSGIVDLPAGALEHLDGGPADLRVEVVGERVRPEQHRAARGRPVRRPPARDRDGATTAGGSRRRTRGIGGPRARRPGCRAGASEPALT